MFFSVKGAMGEKQERERGRYKGREGEGERGEDWGFAKILLIKRVPNFTSTSKKGPTDSYKDAF